MKHATLAVSEIFGPTIQGEGPYLGHPTMFLRLAGCNLSCVWCDTPYTWDWKRFDPRKEIVSMTTHDAWTKIFPVPWYGPYHLVITGGEPMLQQKALLEMAYWRYEPKVFFEIETAGTVMPTNLEVADHFNISPKLSNSENDYAKRIRLKVLEKFMYATSRAYKFVVQNMDDLEEIDALVEEVGISPIYVMPEGVTTEKHRQALTEELVAEIIARDWRITPRLHIDLFGNRRGV